MSANGSTGGGGSLSIATPAGVIALIATWLVTNFVIQPARWTVAYSEWALETALNTFDNTVRGSLETVGSSLWTNAVVTPRDAIFNAIDGLAGSAGIASPVVVGIIAITVVGIVLLVVVVAVRYGAGYIPGGSYIQ